MLDRDNEKQIDTLIALATEGLLTPAQQRELRELHAHRRSVEPVPPLYFPHTIDPLVDAATADDLVLLVVRSNVTKRDVVAKMIAKYTELAIRARIGEGVTEELRSTFWATRAQADEYLDASEEGFADFLDIEHGAGRTWSRDECIFWTPVEGKARWSARAVMQAAGIAIDGDYGNFVGGWWLQYVDPHLLARWYLEESSKIQDAPRSPWEPVGFQDRHGEVTATEPLAMTPLAREILNAFEMKGPRVGISLSDAIAFWKRLMPAPAPREVVQLVEPVPAPVVAAPAPRRAKLTAQQRADLERLTGGDS